MLEAAGQRLGVRLFAAVEGGDGEVHVVSLGVVADGVAIRDQRAEAHHAVRVGRHLRGVEERQGVRGSTVGSQPVAGEPTRGGRSRRRRGRRRTGGGGGSRAGD